VLTVIRCLIERSEKGGIRIKDISDLFVRGHGEDYGRLVTSRWIGHVVRRKLNLITQKSHGIYAIPQSERPKLEALFERFGVTREDGEALDVRSSELSTEPVDSEDLGDIGAAPVAG